MRAVVQAEGYQGQRVPAKGAPTLLTTTIQCEVVSQEPCGCLIGRLRNIETGREAFYLESQRHECFIHSWDYWAWIDQSPPPTADVPGHPDAVRSRNAEERLRCHVRRILKEKRLTRKGFALAAGKSKPWASGYVGKQPLRFPMHRLDVSGRSPW
jgi:hypothetical protein